MNRSAQTLGLDRSTFSVPIILCSYTIMLINCGIRISFSQFPNSFVNSSLDFRERASWRAQVLNHSELVATQDVVKV